MKKINSKLVGHPVFIAVLGAILCVAQLLADPLDTWETRHPTPSGDSYFYGAGQWIGLRGMYGAAAEITHSTDAVSWSRSQIPFDFIPDRAVYANGLWVVIGRERTLMEFSAMLTSTDGRVWEKQTSGFELFRSLNINPRIFGVAYGDGLWMAMGWKGQYLTSANGAEWSPGAIAGGQDIVSISYGNGRWLALSSGGISSSGYAYVSTNGTNWTTHALPFGVIGAAFAAGQWTALVFGGTGRALVTSTDGIDWVTRHVISGSEIYRQIGYGDGRWLSAGVTDPNIDFVVNLVTLTSTDGSTWERSVVPTPDFRSGLLLESLCYGDGLWLLAGRKGYVGVELLASTNAVEWSSRTERVTDGSLTDMVYAAGQWTAVGQPSDPENNPGFVIATSFDGRHWSTGHASGNGHLLAVAYGEGRWVAAGMRFNHDPYGVILTSTNGSEWISTLEGPAGSGFAGVAFGNGMWVVSMGSLLTTSPDGVHWTSQALAVRGSVGRVRFANGRWMVLGRRQNESGELDSFILTSTDAINWVEAAGIEGNALFDEVSDVHFGDGMWIVLASRMHPDGIRRPTTFRSTNGTDWAMRDLGVEFTIHSRLISIIHVAGRWMIKGNDSRLWSSVDGEEWTEHFTGLTSGSLRSDGRYVLLFDGGEIRASERLTPAVPPSLSVVREGQEIALWLSGEIGEQFEIEQSLDLDEADWILLQRITLTTDPQKIVIDLPTGNRGFWRARGPVN